MANKTLIETECFHCGASLNVDLDNLVSTCPYCDQKVLINPDAYKDIIAEHEATKREEMRIAHEKEQLRARKEAKEQSRKTKLTLGVVGAIFLFLGFIFVDFSEFIALGLMMVGIAAFFALLFVSDDDELVNSNETTNNKNSKPARKKTTPPKIAKVTIASSETSKDVGSVVVRGAVGGALLGPLGLLLGFTAEEKTKTTFVVEYDDGQVRTETAKSDSDRYKELCKYL